MSHTRIVFFDGECNLCNGFVDFAVRRNGSGHLKFASLQGETAAQLLADKLLSDLSTVVFFSDGKVFTQSTAVLHIFLHFGFLWRVLARIAFLCPQFIRDGLYKFVAFRRYQFFGQRSSCRLPTDEEKSYFLA